MNEISSWIKYFSAEQLWMLQVFAVVFFVLLFNFVAKRALARLHARLYLTRALWDDAFVDALQRPLRLFVWIVGIAFAAEIVQSKTGAVIFDAIDPVRDIGVIGTICWFLIRVVMRIENNIITKHEKAGEKIDRTTVDAIGKLIRASIIITSVLVTLQTLGYSVSGVMAFGGVGGIAIGFAAKDLLANFFGGLMIYLDRPFEVGDWIRSPDRDIEGTVEKIGWRLSVIRTFDKRPLYIPNSTFASIAVENPSRMSNRRIYETIGIRYADIVKMETITKEVREMLVNHDAIDSNLTLMVNFNAFSPSSIDFFVYCFTHTTVWTEFHDVKQDVLLKISHIIVSNGAEIAFPTSTVHVPDGIAINPNPVTPIN
ncbi:MAG: mechanosensitive ion channel family protein [Gammaproteobacteria bacterium]|nr:mechanosensitive ion channel family protein [Gammaproteobacteria bacterium]